MKYKKIKIINKLYNSKKNEENIFLVANEVPNVNAKITGKVIE